MQAASRRRIHVVLGDAQSAFQAETVALEDDVEICGINDHHLLVG